MTKSNESLNEYPTKARNNYLVTYVPGVDYQPVKTLTPVFYHGRNEAGDRIVELPDGRRKILHRDDELL